MPSIWNDGVVEWGEMAAGWQEIDMYQVFFGAFGEIAKENRGRSYRSAPAEML